MVMQEVSADVISRVAKDVFGNHVVVQSFAQIQPIYERGIPRISGCNANLSYIICLSPGPRKYVIRFSRGYREDRFEREVKNYQMIADRTNIPTPRIYSIDRSTRIVPTSYMIMDWMLGETWTFLSHPDNPRTTREEKDYIRKQTGRCYAQIHSIKRTVERPDVVIEKLLYRLDQLRNVVLDGQYDIDFNKIDACRQAIVGDRDLLIDMESLCVRDAEIHFVKLDGRWLPSFICDMEWVDFGDPYFDLVDVCSPRDFWELESPLLLEDHHSIARQSFFEAYEKLRSVDYERLSRVATYAHFNTMCAITDQIYRPDKRQFMQTLQPKYVALVDAIVTGSTD